MQLKHLVLSARAFWVLTVLLTPVMSALADSADACAPLTAPAASPEETAWRLFVTATCPVNADRYPYVVWERWADQNQVYGQATPALLAEVNSPRRFHASPLALMLRENKKAQAKHLPLTAFLSEAASQDCPVSRFGRKICEETRLNPDTQAYVVTNGLETRAGQQAFVKDAKPFVFTRPSIEVKADWIKLDNCANLPSGVHVETVAGSCYALAGFHLISKLIDNWVWATFEPQNAETNPRRCQILGCRDPWGSVPASTNGPSTAQSPALTALMDAAHLAPEWRNYRLNGVQVDFLDSNGQPSILGNSIIEGENAGGPAEMKKSSCITCHALSSVNANGNQGPVKFIVGPQPKLPAGFESRDFVWSFLLAK